MKTKKFVGYVPKGETLKDTLDFYCKHPHWSNFGMETKASEIYNEKVVKRTITLSWEDEPVKEKK